MANPNPVHKFKPGKSGNPAGRPRGRGFTDVLRAALREEIEPGKTYLRAIVDAAVRKASDGDMRAIELIADRLDRSGLAAELEYLRAIVERVRVAGGDPTADGDGGGPGAPGG